MIRRCFLFFFFLVCATAAFTQPTGKLFIIGGGDRPPAMMLELVTLSGLDRGGYAVILPMSSSEPDTAAYYFVQSLTEVGVLETKLHNFPFVKGAYPQPWLDSVANATLIFITGGDQNRFMEVVQGSPVVEAIHTAYRRGATIAGTSAGAAVMSRLMITGNQLKRTDAGSSFRTIEAGNVELKEGLGLVEDVIIDQHFVYRMRLNRLLTAVLEHPGHTGIGIDEATAIIVTGNRARVTGEGQVVVIRSPRNVRRQADGRLRGSDLRVSILLPGEEFRW